MMHLEDNRFFRVLPGSGEAVGRSFVQRVGKTHGQCRVGHARSKSESHVERLRARKARKCGYHHRAPEDRGKKASWRRGKQRQTGAEARSSARREEEDDIIASIVSLYRDRDVQRGNASSTSGSSSSSPSHGSPDAESAASGGSPERGNPETENFSSEQSPLAAPREGARNGDRVLSDFFSITCQDWLRSFQDRDGRDQDAQSRDCSGSDCASAGFPSTSRFEAMLLGEDLAMNRTQQCHEEVPGPSSEDQQSWVVLRKKAVLGNAEGEICGGRRSERDFASADCRQDEISGRGLAQLNSALTENDVEASPTLSVPGVKPRSGMSTNLLCSDLGLERGASDDIPARLRRLRRPLSDGLVEVGVSGRTQIQQNLRPDVRNTGPRFSRTLSKSDDEIWIGRKPLSSDSNGTSQSRPEKDDTAISPEKKTENDPHPADTKPVKSDISGSPPDDSTDIEFTSSDLENFASWAFTTLDRESEDKDTSRGSSEARTRVDLQEVVEFINAQCGTRLMVACPCQNHAQDEADSRDSTVLDCSARCRDRCCTFRSGSSHCGPDDSALVCEAGEAAADTSGDDDELSVEYTSSEESGDSHAECGDQDMPRRNDTLGRERLASAVQNADEEQDDDSDSGSHGSSEDSVDEDEIADNGICKCRWQCYLVQDTNNRGRGCSDTRGQGPKHSRGEENTHASWPRGSRNREILHNLSSTSSEETSRKLAHHIIARKARAGSQTKPKAIYMEDEIDSSVSVSSSEDDSIDSHGYSRVSARDFLGHLEDIASSSSNSCCSCANLLGKNLSDSSGSSWESSGNELICTEFYREHLGWVPPISEDEFLRRSHLERLEESLQWERELQRLWMGVEENDEGSGRRWRKGRRQTGAMRIAGDRTQGDWDSMSSGESDVQASDWELQGSGYAADVDEDSCASDPGGQGESSVFWSECGCKALKIELPESMAVDGLRTIPTLQQCVMDAMAEYWISSSRDTTDEEIIIPEYLFREEKDASSVEKDQAAEDTREEPLGELMCADSSSPQRSALWTPSQEEKSLRQASCKSSDMGTDYFSVLECPFEGENGLKMEPNADCVDTDDSEFTTVSESAESVIECLGKEEENSTAPLWGNKAAMRGQEREETSFLWARRLCLKTGVRIAANSRILLTDVNTREVLKRHAHDETSNHCCGRMDWSDESKDSLSNDLIDGRSRDSQDDDNQISLSSSSISSEKENTAIRGWLGATDELPLLNTNSNAANTGSTAESQTELHLDHSQGSKPGPSKGNSETCRRRSTSRKAGARPRSISSESRMGASWDRQARHRESPLTMSEFSSVVLPKTTATQDKKETRGPPQDGPPMLYEEGEMDSSVPSLKDLQEQQLASSMRLAGIKTSPNTMTVYLKRQASGLNRQVVQLKSPSKCATPKLPSKCATPKLPSKCATPKVPSKCVTPKLPAALKVKPGAYDRRERMTNRCNEVVGFDYSRRTVPRSKNNENAVLPQVQVSPRDTLCSLRTTAMHLGATLYFPSAKKGKPKDSKSKDNWFDTKPWSSRKRFEVYSNTGPNLWKRRKTQGMNINRHISSKKRSNTFAPYYEQVLDRSYRAAGSALHGVTVDSQGHIYVADTDASLVYRLPCIGPGLHGTREVLLGPKNGIDRPWALYVDRQRSILYVSQMNGVIKVFQLPTEAASPTSPVPREP